MPRNPSPPPRAVREPVQVYLAPEDSELLNRMSSESGLSKAEVLRRGVRSFAREQSGGSPMLRFVMENAAGAWPSNVAEDHDAVIAGTHAIVRKCRS